MADVAREHAPDDDPGIHAGATELAALDVAVSIRARVCGVDLREVDAHGAPPHCEIPSEELDERVDGLRWKEGDNCDPGERSCGPPTPLDPILRAQLIVVREDDDGNVSCRVVQLRGELGELVRAVCPRRAPQLDRAAPGSVPRVDEIAHQPRRGDVESAEDVVRNALHVHPEPLLCAFGIAQCRQRRGPPFVVAVLVQRRSRDLTLLTRPSDDADFTAAVLHLELELVRQRATELVASP